MNSKNTFSQTNAISQIVGNAGWLFADRIIALAFGLFVGIWVARYLGPEQFGLLNFATSFVGLFGAISTLGLQNIVVRDLVQNPEDAQLTLGSTVVLQFLGGLGAFLLIAITIQILRPDDDLARSAVIILGFGMVLKVSAVSRYWFEATVRSKYIVWITSSAIVLTSALKVALILQGAPLIAFVWVTLANTVLTALGVLLVFHFRAIRVQDLRISLQRARKLTKDGWPLLIAGLAVAMYMKIDMVMLGQMLGDDAAGIYGAAVRLSEVWYFVPMIIVASVFPSILEAKKHNNDLYYFRLQQLYDFMVLLAFVGALLTTFFSDFVIAMLFGKAYSASSGVLSIHIWASIFVFLGVASGKWFIAENRQILLLKRGVIGALSNVGLNLLLIPRFGPQGAAWATVGSYAAASFFFDAFQADTRQVFTMKLRSMNLLRNFGTSRESRGLPPR